MPLFTKEIGNPNNPPLVFLHGFMGSHKDFAPMIEELKSDFFCICLDLPGHGQSKACLFNSYSDFQLLIEKSLAPYKEFKLSIVGYSMGGRIALQLFSKFTIKSLILISSKVEPLTKEQKKLRALLEQKWIKKLAKDSFSNFLTKWYSSPLFSSLTSSQLSEVISRREKEDPKLLAKVLKHLSPIHLFAPESFFSEFKSPLLYLTGSLDQKYCKEAKSVQKHFPWAWLQEEACLSHALHIEAPKELTNYIKHFYRYYHDRVEARTSV